jgi:hypothetical protein
MQALVSALSPILQLAPLLPAWSLLGLSTSRLTFSSFAENGVGLNGNGYRALF